MKQTLHGLIQKLGPRAAGMILILLPALFLVFHALILMGLLPKNIVWGGRLTDATFYPLEALAIVLNLLLMLAGSVALGYVTAPRAGGLIDKIKWFLFYFVVFNTIGGLFSTTTFEMLLTPVTALYALCLYRLIRFPDGFDIKTGQST